jgi:hypothetical protein
VSRCRWFIVSVSGILTTCPCISRQVTTTNVSAAPFVLSGDVQELPIALIKGYAFVEAEVNGVAGKLMLDTGHSDANGLVLNDHRIPFKDGTVVGSGFFGSGQRFTVWTRPVVDKVTLANRLTYAGLTNIRSQNASMLEAITPDFLGWVGYAFWSNYALKLDYKNSIATFYRNDMDGGPERAFVKAERVISVLPYENRKLAGHPVMAVTLGSLSFTAAWDNGQYGGLWISREIQDQMIKERTLGLESDGQSYSLSNIRVGGVLVKSIPHVEIHHEPFAAAKVIGITEQNVMTFGFGLLNQYTTVWDYQAKKIYLLER